MNGLESEITAEINTLKASIFRLHVIMLAIRGPGEREFNGALNHLTKAIIGLDSMAQGKTTDQ